MTEVEKMRSSQLADMSAPELQVRFEHAKKGTENCWKNWCRVFLKLR